MTPAAKPALAVLLGSQIRSWRMVLGLTAQQLADRASVSTDTLAKIESGTSNPGWLSVLSVLESLELQDKVTAAIDPTGTDLGRSRAHLINRRRAK